jgi:hypothetical protein
MCISSWNTRPKWRSPRWSIASRESPRVVFGNSILTLLHGITRAYCGPQVILLPHVAGHRCLSFVSTLKTNGKQPERCALTTLYARPERRGFTVGFGKGIGQWTPALDGTWGILYSRSARRDRQEGYLRARLRCASSTAKVDVITSQYPSAASAIRKAALPCGLCAAVNSTLASRNSRLTVGQRPGACRWLDVRCH